MVGQEAATWRRSDSRERPAKINECECGGFMRMLRLDLEDGMGLVSVVVAGDVEADRLQRFMRDSLAAISMTADQPLPDFYEEYS